MGDLYLFSTNPWYSHELAVKYLAGKHFVWCSDYYDPSGASAISSTALTAPSSSPRGIYNQLFSDCDHEDTHSSLIKSYRKTIKRLTSDWLATGIITINQKDEIITTINSGSWKIWRPLLYIIYKPPIIASSRLQNVPMHLRAAYGNEWKIIDLDTSEFEIIER